MKRDRVYLSKPDRLPFAPDQASALTRLMAVLESSFDGIFITDGQATPLWCNHSYEIISGLTAAERAGHPHGPAGGHRRHFPLLHPQGSEPGPGRDPGADLHHRQAGRGRQHPHLRPGRYRLPGRDQRAGHFPS